MLRIVVKTGVVFILFAPMLAAQTFDFEGSLDGFAAEGASFANQPIEAKTILTDRLAPVSLGGDYWTSLVYPMGQHGDYLIATAARYGDGATGALVSRPIPLEGGPRYFSLLVGGTKDAERERVELELRMSPEEQAGFQSRTGPLSRDGDFVVLRSYTGGGYEQMRQEIFRIPDFLLPRDARIKIVDASASGHINVDYLQITDEAPDARKTPIWGYADYHTHPMNHLAFGGLKGQFIIWGAPGGNYDDYVRHPELIYEDLVRCETGHGGGAFANPFLNAAQKFSFAPSLGLLIPHGHHGAPDFKDWPAFNAGAHQQMHITQIHRNYEGGLRLMVGLATDNLGAEYLVSPVEGRSVRLVPEKDSLEAQIKGMVEMARLNSSWMQIAYSPADAREVILHNKLAVVMGIEVDQLGQYGFKTTAEEIDYLWNMGVRVVTPIHAIDNRLGGPMVFFDIYNWANDLFHRPKVEMTKKEAQTETPAFFDVEDETCVSSSVGACVEYKPSKSQQRLYLGTCLESPLRISPCLVPVDDPAFGRIQNGVKNSLGLTDFGHEYIRTLIDRGFILDTAHMSDKSLAETYGVIGEKLAQDHPDCTVFTFYSGPQSGCDQWTYPAIVSHAHFRGQAWHNDAWFPPSEYDISDRNIEMVRRTGGVLGPFIAEDRMSKSGLIFAPDCSLSSGFFGYSFHFARAGLGPGSNRVGMATDFTLIPGTAPRFGKNACWGYHLAEDPKKEKKTHPERYNVRAQLNGVVYEGMKPKRSVKVGMNAPLKPDRLGRRTFDVNVDGLAHFGMVPDVLQDLKNLGWREDLQAMFASAEGYIEMWEKSERVAGSPSLSRLQPRLPGRD